MAKKASKKPKGMGTSTPEGNIPEELVQAAGVGEQQGERAVITVVGVDRVGIVARVTAELAECGANVIDLRSTLMHDLFTMIILVDLSEFKAPFEEMQERLSAASEDLQVQIRTQHESVFRFMHRI